MRKPLQTVQDTAVHVEELQEIVGRPPGGIVRWGTLTLFIALVTILAISFLVKYSDVLTGKFTLSAANAPKSVIAHTDGKLMALFVKEKDIVKQGQVLAYIESNANHEEILKLSDNLQKLWLQIQENNWNGIGSFQPGDYKNLGELQSAFQQFVSAYIQLNAYLENGMYVRKKELLENELNNLHKLALIYKSQETVLNQDLEIASQQFEAVKKLYEEKVIARMEYRNEESKFLNKKLPVEGLRQSIVSNGNAIANKLQEKVQLEQQFNDQKSSFLQAVNTLNSKTDDWKKKYLLVAPVAGSITFPVLLQRNQDVKQNQELFYISSPQTGYYGEVTMSQQSFGKMRVGQTVMITLEGYPYQEYGKLPGKVSFISHIPNKDKEYYVAISLDNGLITDRRLAVSYQNGLTGTAEIITQKTRLASKLLYAIREILDKPGTH
jgi:HlyD family secretion protein